MSRRKQPAKGKDRTAAIKRAAAKAFPNGAPAAEPTTAPDQFMVDAHNLVGLAERIFEHAGYFSPQPDTLIREALRATRDDLDLFDIASRPDNGVPGPMVFMRAMARIDLAFAIADFRERHGWDLDPRYGTPKRPLRIEERERAAARMAAEGEVSP